MNPPLKDPWPGLPKWLIANPVRLIANTFVVLAVTWIAVLILDVYGSVEAGTDHVWPFLFNRGPIEFAQWPLLVGAITGSAFLAGRVGDAHGVRLQRFLRLMPLGLGFMLIEEAGDIRSTLRHLLSPSLPEDVVAGLSGSMLVEMTFYVAMAAIPVYAILRYGSEVLPFRLPRRILFAGVASYGIAATLSATEPLFGLLEAIGRFFHETLPGSGLLVSELYDQDMWYFLFGDGPVEESLELLGAMFFCALFMALARDLCTTTATASGVRRP